MAGSLNATPDVDEDTPPTPSLSNPQDSLEDPLEDPPEDPPEEPPEEQPEDPPPPDPPKPPRPANSWILYRAWKIKHLPPAAPGESRRNQGDVSSLVSAMWKNERPDVRAYFERLAEEAKEEHRLKYPDYRYQPQKRDTTQKGKAKAKVPPKGITKKKETRAIRGVGHEIEPSTSHSQRPSHPYPLSSRPRRVPYDRIGPSPPLSAASSPSPCNSPLPANSYPFLSTDGGASGGVSLPSTSNQQPTEIENDFLPPQFSSSHYTQSPLDVIPPWQLVDQALPSAITTWDPSTTGGVEPNALYFDIPSHQTTDWASTHFSCGHLPNEHNFNCFLSDISPEMPLDAQSGEIEISVGHAPSGSRPIDFQDLFSMDGGLPYDFGADLFQADDSHFDDILLGLGSQHSYATNGDASENFDSSQVSAELASYIPPSGASQSATRRVAGNWTQYLQDLDASSAQYEVSV